MMTMILLLQNFFIIISSMVVTYLNNLQVFPDLMEFPKFNKSLLETEPAIIVLFNI